VSVGDFQTCDVIANVMNAHSETLVNWAAVRTRPVEAGRYNVIGVRKALSGNKKRLSVMPGWGHWMDVVDNSFRNLATPLT
jgi:hypothetical protein